MKRPSLNHTLIAFTAAFLAVLITPAEATLSLPVVQPSSAQPSSFGSAPQEASSQLSNEQIDEATTSVMSDNEFRSVRRLVIDKIPESELSDADKGFLRGISDWMNSFVDTFFDGLGEFLRSLFGAAGQQPTTPSASASSGGLFSGIANIIVLLAVVALVAIIVLFATLIVRSIDGKKRRERAGGLLFDGTEAPEALSTPPGETEVGIYERRALQLAQEGNYRAAIRELLLGSMSWIERSGQIRYRKGLTNRDYIRAIWKKKTHRDAFAVTAREFERIYFGRRTATQEMFQHCLTQFQGAFREEAPLAAV